MKKVLMIVAVLVLSFGLLISPTYAKNDNSNRGKGPKTEKVDNPNKPDKNSPTTTDTPEDDSTPVGDVENGDESGEEPAQPETKHKKAKEKMNVVSRAVHAMNEYRKESDEKGGIGDRVRVVAQNQEEIQEMISNDLDTLGSRSSFIKLFIGTDYNAVDSLEEEIALNNTQIAELEATLLETTDPEEQVLIENAILALQEQNVELQDVVDEELSAFSLFGWLFDALRPQTDENE